MLIRSLFAAAAIIASGQISAAATLAQTVHFNGAAADKMFQLYMTSQGHQAITGLPADFQDGEGNSVAEAVVGGQLQAFCFQPGQCGLNARVLDIQSSPGSHTVVMAWWNFGWLQAVDKSELTVEGRGAQDSILTLTFRDTLRGAQVELVQVNVPDYKVVIPNPDGSQDTGPLSQIVNTHWNTLYWDNLRGLVE